MTAFESIQSLLREKAEYKSRLSLLPYDGTPEIKNQSGGKYLYIRKRVAGKLTSTYVGIYSEELHAQLLRYAREAREYRKQIRHLDKKLAELGYKGQELSAGVIRNLDFARANLKVNIYDQAVLEGVATSFPQTEEILENGKVMGVTVSDVQKILNLKHAWEFILDQDIIQAKSDYYLLAHIAGLVNEGFFAEPGRVRSVPVSIGGTSYVPPIPMEADVKEDVQRILADGQDAVDTAVSLCLYCMRTQIFLDGNKRAAVIFANHYLIAHGQGLLVIPEKDVPAFKGMLVRYYESGEDGEIRRFLKEKCHKGMRKE